MQSLEASLDHIRLALPPPVGESISLNEARGRILLEECVAPVDLPGFDNSAMDGYAVRSADVAAASADHPATLRVQGKIAAGDVFSDELQPGACIRIFTGSPLPRGADAVVMQEDTRIEAKSPAEVAILDTAKPWENVRFQGEDLKRGARAVTAGSRLGAGQLSLLAAIGVTTVRVGRQPVVGLLATGSELQAAGQPLAPGKIYESNRAGIAALTAGAGAIPRLYPLVADTPEATRLALEQALTECDILITSGGVSVGEFDYVKSAFAELGGKLEFWRVAIKPGRPFVFGRWREKFLFGLPGNPISALVTFLALVRPALLQWQGASQTGLPGHPGIAAEPLVNRGNRRHLMRVRVDHSGTVHLAGPQASHIVSSLAEANGLVDVPPETTIAAGQSIHVQRWDFA